MPKTATVQYRRLKRDGLPWDNTLKSEIVTTMQALRNGRRIGETIANRQFDLDQDRRITLLNKISEEEHWDQPFFGGQLTYFERGANVPAILGDPDDDVNELDLGQFDLADDASMIHGILYFVVVDDHVGLIESTGLRSARLERFLTQLMTSSGRLDPGQVIELDAQFRNEDGRRVNNATEVQVAARRAHRSENPGGLPQLVERDIEQARREGHSVIRVLEALDWSPGDIERLMSEVPEGGWLEGFFRFFIKSRGQRRTIKRNTLENAFRNVDPADVTFLARGKRERDGYVKLTQPRTVQTVHSMLNPTSAIQEIEGALRNWAEQGEIDLQL